MTSSTPTPLFVADEVALDFINTAYGVAPDHIECLASDQQVLEWLERAGLTREFESEPATGKRGALLQAALELRENAQQLVERRKAGASADVAALNRILALGNAHRQMIWKRGQEPSIQLLRTGSGPEVLVPLAEALATLLVEGDFDLVRKCESADCTLWFYDRTKSHHRRWCSMAICGNRAKVAAFRERQKG